MFCRKCGRDMGDSLFCPDCGTKQRMDGCEPVSEGNYANASQLKSEAFEKYKKTTKIINTITSILVALLTLILFIIAFSAVFLEIDFSKASTEESNFKLALECAIQACAPIAFMFSGDLLISYVRNLITTLILRSTVTKNNLSPHDLLPYTQINGAYTINTVKRENGDAWCGLAFIEHSPATRCIVARSIIGITHSLIEALFMLIYGINLSNRLTLAGGLPSENLFAFFVSPTLIIIILSFITWAVVDTILYSKMKKGFEEIKTKYSK